ncbi:hypothetical protein [Parasitella parasitica]|uniref:Uncharacterized protein n=1 Tax=Parasitella parasitica TaxID=35722 RepID=A0A0B7MX47_9FUNG|nr:hypothetical protein [Parasitella parasitica]
MLCVCSPLPRHNSPRFNRLAPLLSTMIPKLPDSPLLLHYPSCRTGPQSPRPSSSDQRFAMALFASSPRPATDYSPTYGIPSLSQIPSYFLS